MRKHRALALILASLWLSSCGSTATNGSENKTPTIEKRELPAISLNEGESATVANVTGSVAESDGLEAETNGSNLTLRAPYGASGRKTITINGSNSVITQPVDIRVAVWSSIPTFDAGPEAREHGALIVDDGGRRVILIGGSGYKPYGTPLADIWAWSLTTRTWTKLTAEGDVPPAGGSRRVAGSYMFGGYAAASETNNELYRFQVGPTSIQFKKLTTTIPPRSLHAFVKAGDKFVVFGGASTKPLNDTWELKIDGDTATATLLMASGPTARYGFFYGADEERLIVFSGAQSFSTVKPAQDTWALSFADKAWTQIAIENGPKGRRNGCFVYDPKFKRLFVFGGTADAMTSEAGFSILDARVGREAWTTVARAGEPPLRSSGIGFWDPNMGSATCGFGNTTMAVYADWATFGPTIGF